MRDIDKLIKQHEQELAAMRAKAKGEKRRRPATKAELAERYPILKGYVEEDDDTDEDGEPAGNEDDDDTFAKLKEKYPGLTRKGGMSQQSKKVVKRKKRADEIGKYSADAEAAVFKTSRRLDKVRRRFRRPKTFCLISKNAKPDVLVATRTQAPSASAH